MSANSDETSEQKRIESEILRLLLINETPEVGSSDWLAICELEMGGIQVGVRRNKVSEFDPRTKDQIKSGGMIGGDRMIHHNYSTIYEKYLNRFISKNINLSIIECGILMGTGLGVWSKLFPQATLVGMDIDLSHILSNMEELKKRGAFMSKKPILIEFDQFKPSTISLQNAVGDLKFNILIDDGFHSDETILNTFSALQPFFAEDFVYFAEDNMSVSKKICDLYPGYKVTSYGQMTVITSKY